MDNVKKNMDNQTVGLLPLLLFMFLDNYFSYLFSFLAGLAFCLMCLLLFRLLGKDKIYQFLLLPSALTMFLYSIVLWLRIEPLLFAYSPIITEILLTLVLTFMSIAKSPILRWIRASRYPPFRRTQLRIQLNEFFFIAQVVQNLYTLHLFVVLFYNFLPDAMQNVKTEQFLYRELGIVIGLSFILYEQIRITMMRGSLKKEMWLPVLNDQGKIVGCIARSVSRALPKRYYHPVIRIAVVYQGMLYLTKRGKNAFVFPDTFDYPFRRYVLFRHSIENSIYECMGELGKEEDLFPRFLLRYTYENEKVKHLVSLYAICIRSEKTMNRILQPDGKLWTVKEIVENIGTGVFSEYFEQEFPYLQSTVLPPERMTEKTS